MSWEAIKEILLWLEPYGFVFVVALCAYSFVLMIGRGLDLVESYKIKNMIAIVYIYIGTACYFYFYKGETLSLNLALLIIMFGSFSMLFYMIVLWRFFARADAFLDKWFASDEDFKKNPKNKKKILKSHKKK